MRPDLVSNLIISRRGFDSLPDAFPRHSLQFQTKELRSQSTLQWTPSSWQTPQTQCLFFPIK